MRCLRSSAWSIPELRSVHANLRTFAQRTNSAALAQRSGSVVRAIANSELQRAFRTVYVLPALFSAYGQVLSLAELIASGYAALSKKVVRVQCREAVPVDVDILFHSGSCW